MTHLDFELSSLLIIGYADSLSEAFVPQVVPPIFRLRNKPQTVVMPPFRIENDRIVEAHAGTAADLERAVVRGQATHIDVDIDARPGYRLWIDEAFKPHYEPAEVVADTLRRLAQRKARAAQDALTQGRLAEAMRLAQTAISADDGCLNAILVKALVHQLEGDQASVEILIEIAGMIVPDADFQAWIEFFSALVIGRIGRQLDESAGSKVSFVAEPASRYHVLPLDSGWRGGGGRVEEEWAPCPDWRVLKELKPRFDSFLSGIKTVSRQRREQLIM